MFEPEIKKAFPGTERHVRQGELKNCSRKNVEIAQLYVQSALELRPTIHPEMGEEEKLAHLMKSVTEDLYQALN